VFHITPFVKITKETVYEVATGVSSPGEQMKSVGPSEQAISCLKGLSRASSLIFLLFVAAVTLTFVIAGCSCGCVRPDMRRYYPDLPSRMVVIPRDPARQTQLRTFDVPPVHVFHFGTSKENHTTTPGVQQQTTDTVQSIEFSAVCLPKGFSMFPTQVRKETREFDSAVCRCSPSFSAHNFPSSVPVMCLS
jgi:hypothetical protein